MTVVVDASIVVAVLVDAGPDGRWAESVIAGQDLVAPHLLPVEVANILRRLIPAGEQSPDTATHAHADLLDLPIRLQPYEPYGERIWELRDNVTAYDAWYVAVAELLDVPLVTLDDRLARASGPRCRFLTP